MGEEKNKRKEKREEKKLRTSNKDLPSRAVMFVKGEYVMFNWLTQRTHSGAPALVAVVAIIWSDSLAWVVPLKEDLTTWVRQWNGTVLADSSSAVEASDIITNTTLVRRRIGAGSSRTETGRLVEASLGGVAARAVWLVK